MAKTVELECAECGKTFEKAKGEYDRQVREGRDPDHFFCSLSCSCAYGNHKNPNKADTEHLDPGNLRDQYSPFRYFVRKARERSKEYDIDVQYLKNYGKNKMVVGFIRGGSWIILPRHMHVKRQTLPLELLV